MADGADIPDTPARLTFLPGAHKTASTHIQNSLQEAAPALAEHGIALMMPKITRDLLQPLAYELRDHGASDALRARAARVLADHAPGASHLIIMDENILGGTKLHMLFGDGILYPWAQRRLGNLMALFPRAQIHVGLAIRDLVSFLPSAWSEELSHIPAPIPFETFMQGVDAPALRWSELVERLAACAPDRFFLWRYEDYTRDPAPVFQALLGTQAGLVPRLKKRFRPGLSAPAAQWLFAQPDPSRALLKDARRKYPLRKGHAPLDPWPPAARKLLDLAQAEDLNRIARMQGVESLGQQS